jgi:hypothetical protein
MPTTICHNPRYGARQERSRQSVSRATSPSSSLTDNQLLDTMLARPIVVTEKGTRLCCPSAVVLEILENPDIGAYTKEDGEIIPGKDAV